MLAPSALLAAAGALAATYGLCCTWRVRQARRALRERLQGPPVGRPAGAPGLLDLILSSLHRLGSTLLPHLLEPAAAAALARRLQHSGLPPGLTPAAFLGLQAALAAVGLAAGTALAGGLLLPVLLAAACWRLPPWWLAAAARRRRAQIAAEVPDCLDVLAAGLAAGSAPDRALRLLAVRFPGALAVELRRCFGEMDLGVPRRRALQDLMARCREPGVDWLVEVLLDGLDLGVPLARALAVQAGHLRRARLLVAREQAARRAPLLTLVVTALLVPGVLALLLGLVGLNFWFHPERFGLGR